MKNYVVAARHPWNRSAFVRRTPHLPGTWHLIERREDLTEARLRDIQPRYVFFPHWSWEVPEAIWRNWECVCFHMADVPYGRGGSPLQNLIVRGHRSTMLTALRMERELDAGPVYLKRPLDLSGRAQAIFERAAEMVYDLAEDIVVREPTPVQQSGEPVVFRRRTPQQSALPADAPAEGLYDHIRMLDAEGYPPAFLDFGGWRLEFSEAEMTADQVTARVVFRRLRGEKE